MRRCVITFMTLAMLSCGVQEMTLFVTSSDTFMFGSLSPERPNQAETFQGAMTNFSAVAAQAILKAYDFTGVRFADAVID
jgi:hypothetical protein